MLRLRVTSVMSYFFRSFDKEHLVFYEDMSQIVLVTSSMSAYAS